MSKILDNVINGELISSLATDTFDVIDPATEEILARTPLGTSEDVDRAVEAASNFFPEWKSTPTVDRIQPFFRLKSLLEKHIDELSELLTKEHGKTLIESKGEMRRGIQMVESATAMTNYQIGECGDQIANGIDCVTFRAPLGVFAGITPFNFPSMVPFWFWPFAVASGNTYVLKPSERVPLTQMRIFELIKEAGFPPGAIQLVHGGKEAVTRILEHPDIQGVSFVGSTPIAKLVYEKGSATGKRVQALGGAKNTLVILPDAPVDKAVKTMVESCLGCAGERCLAGSILLGVGDAYEAMKSKVLEEVEKVITGNGSDPKTTMGPVISKEAMNRINADIEKGISEGASLIYDGRKNVPNKGFFVGPVVFENVKQGSYLAKTEIFGPVISLMKADSLDEAIRYINSSNFGNTASIFTSNGGAARKFMMEVDPAMVGVNLGVPAPMSFFSFGGSKDSFFGDIKAHGRSAIDFFTERRTHMVRWFEQTDSISPHWNQDN